MRGSVPGECARARVSEECCVPGECLSVCPVPGSVPGGCARGARWGSGKGLRGERGKRISAGKGGGGGKDLREEREKIWGQRALGGKGEK